MYISLYRKYRPGRFGDVVGQDGIVRILRNSLRLGKVGHALLFSGPRVAARRPLPGYLRKR